LGNGKSKGAGVVWYWVPGVGNELFFDNRMNEVQKTEWDYKLMEVDAD